MATTMNFTRIALALVTGLASTQAAAFLLGTYELDNSDLVSDLLSGNGIADNGTDFFSASGSQWSVWDSGAGQLVPAAAPTELTDSNLEGVPTFLAAVPGSGPLGLELGFNNTTLVNGDGADLAFFFLWDQTANTASVSLNGFTRILSLSDLKDDEGDQQVANGVIWGGETFDNVRLMVGEADLTDFGLAAGAAWNASVGIELVAGADNNSMALSMAAALNTTQEISAVPVPAALPLMLAGLSLLGLAARRRS